MNAGSFALSAIAHQIGYGGVSSIARALGCAQSLVSRWAAGTQRPSRLYGKRIADVYGIRVELWDHTHSMGTKRAKSKRVSRSGCARVQSVKKRTPKKGH